MDSQTDSLETFFPTPRIEIIAGREISILPLRMRQMTGFAKATESFMPLIVASDYMAALMLHLDDVRAAVALVTGEDPEWLAGLYADDMIRLTAAVFEVNLDFFARRLLPAKAKHGAAMTALLIGLAGEPASPGLSVTDTALPNAPS